LTSHDHMEKGGKGAGKGYAPGKSSSSGPIGTEMDAEIQQDMENRRIAQWQVQMDDGTWNLVSPSDNSVLEANFMSDPNACFEASLGPNRWHYRVDLGRMTQTNARKRKSRPLRRIQPACMLWGCDRATWNDRPFEYCCKEHRLADKDGPNGKDLSAFDEVLAALRPLHKELGGTPHFGRFDPYVPKKLKKADLDKSSDYEYVFLTIVGLKMLFCHSHEITRLNNGLFYKANPGVKRLEELCGFTMHADRAGVSSIIRDAPQVLLRAFAVARDKGILREFFGKETFDRTADPCLEGRMGRLLEFLEKHPPADAAASEDAGKPPWEDVSVKEFLATETADSVVGEYLRVFRNLCVWKVAQDAGLSYADAKKAWVKAEGLKAFRGARTSPDVAKICNADTFLSYLMTTGIIEGHMPEDGSPVPKRRIAPNEATKAIELLVELCTLMPGESR